MALANLYPLRPNYTPMISITISIVLSDILKNYFIFQQVTEDSVLSGKLSETAKLTELKSLLYNWGMTGFSRGQSEPLHMDLHQLGASTNSNTMLYRLMTDACTMYLLAQPS